MDFIDSLPVQLASIGHGSSNCGPVLLIFMLAAMKDNNIDMFHLNLDRNSIPGVMIQPDREKKTCPVLDSLHKHFPRRDAK